ncbi:MAG: hypothetical protein JSW25_06765 [Thermoplasmata archaeon]|nr:MAG: hypothetical protein JSW25_06765 [Thermoplasmata archaeon]
MSEDRKIEPHQDMYVAKVSTSKGKNKFLEYVLSNYDKMQTPNITPMFVYKSLNTGETGVVVDAKNSDALTGFLADKVRSRDEVMGVKVDTLVQPVFFDRPDDISELKRFAVTANCEPMACKGVYRQMVELTDFDGICITMVAYLMNDHGQHVTMSVLTPDIGTLNNFIDQHLNNMPGISKVQMSELVHLRKLSTKFEWKRTVQPIAEWESLIGRDYDDRVYKDVDQGC